MSCPECGRRGRGHWPGCTAATPTGRRSPQRGKGRKTGPKDIPRHKCVPEVERFVLTPGRDGGGETRITYYRCKTCHLSMGSK